MTLTVGFGKTVLFSSAVEATRSICRADPSKQCCFFYCTRRDPSGQDVTAFLRLLLVQLCRPPNVSEPLRKIHDLCNEVYPPKLPTYRELLDTLQKVLKLNTTDSPHSSFSSQGGNSEEHQTYYILLDGLDEVPWTDREPFLQVLSLLAASYALHVHVLVSSRSQPDILEMMTQPVLWNQIVTKPEFVQPDVRRYVSHTVEGNSRFSRLSEVARNAITYRVADQARGM